MAKTLLTIILILTSFVAFGQESKREKVSNKTIGAWVFADGKIKGGQFGNIGLESWHTDSIFFYPDMTMEFLSYGPDTKIRKNKGQWDIGDDGEILILNNRTATPPYNEPVGDVELPIKILSRNRLLITYPVVF